MKIVSRRAGRSAQNLRKLSAGDGSSLKASPTTSPGSSNVARLSSCHSVVPTTQEETNKCADERPNAILACEKEESESTVMLT